MPNRIIKESINDSESLSRVSPCAQDLFKRLITYADDYGRFNADFEIMRARLYPREVDAVSVDAIEGWLVELGGIEKVKFYRHANNGDKKLRMFGLLPGWENHQRLRDSRAKTPEPTEEWNDWVFQRFVPIEMKKLIFVRDKFSCQNCKRKFHFPDLTCNEAIRILASLLHIDYVVPFSRGGRASLENLRLLCVICHRHRKQLISVEEMRELTDSRGDSPLIAALNPNPESEENPNPNLEVESESRIAAEAVADRFQEFWQAYPARNGKKLERGATYALFAKLSIQDQALAVLAARNYAEALKDQGISAKDPKRWLRDAKGHEPWRDWIEPAQPTSAVEIKRMKDPIPKAFRPAPVIDATNLVDCPPEVRQQLERLMGGARLTE